jgi:hypothetical protein
MARATLRMHHRVHRADSVLSSGGLDELVSGLLIFRSAAVRFN